MKNIVKRILSAIAAMAVMATTAVAVSADEFNFDMSKAKPTYGGGQSFSTFTRLDGEKRDRNKFSPLWMTKDSTIEITYETSGEYINAPLNLIFQSWTGDLVSSVEDKWVEILPSSFDETHAVFTFEDIAKTYGSEDFYDVYAINISDNDNSLLVKSFVVTNCNIPDEIASTITGGTVTLDDIIYSEGDGGMPVVAESTNISATADSPSGTAEPSGTVESVEESTPSDRTESNEAANDNTSDNEAVKENTANSKVDDTENNKADDVATTNETTGDTLVSENASADGNKVIDETETVKTDEENQANTSNTTFFIIIGISAGVIIAAAIVIIILYKKKNKGRAYRKFK